MSDSENDDWFTKDIDEFVAPTVKAEAKDDAGYCENAEISMNKNPYEAMIFGSKFSREWKCI